MTNLRRHAESKETWRLSWTVSMRICKDAVVAYFIIPTLASINWRRAYVYEVFWHMRHIISNTNTDIKYRSNELRTLNTKREFVTQAYYKSIPC